MEKFLSIIIPVYNTEKYLAECLDSCLEQDIPHHDYEIICVNDGSTDGCAEILERYAREHANIKVITQPNGGVSVARNTGIDAACGEYIWFVDADDFIQSKILGILFRKAQDTGADRICFAHFEFQQKLTEQEQARKNAGNLTWNSSPPGYLIVSSLFRRNLFQSNNLSFRKGISYAEDGLFCYEFSQLNPTTTTIDQVFYYYRRNPASVTRTRSAAAQQKRSDSALQAALVMIEYARKHNEELKGCSTEQRAAVLMPDVRNILISAAQLPGHHRKQICADLRACGLYPLFLYRKPRDWFPKKIHMGHAYMGIKGKVLDVMNFYATTRWGFALLVFYYKLRQRR